MRFHGVTMEHDKRDNRFKTTTAFATVPNVTHNSMAAILRPLRGNQIIATSNTVYPEAGTTTE
jgi:hypothetical protein